MVYLINSSAKCMAPIQAQGALKTQLGVCSEVLEASNIIILHGVMDAEEFC